MFASLFGEQQLHGGSYHNLHLVSAFTATVVYSKINTNMPDEAPVPVYTAHCSTSNPIPDEVDRRQDSQQWPTTKTGAEPPRLHR